MTTISTERFYPGACTKCGLPASVHVRSRGSLDGFVTNVCFHGPHRNCDGTVDIDEAERHARELANRAIERYETLPTKFLYASPDQVVPARGPHWIRHKGLPGQLDTSASVEADFGPDEPR